MVPQPTLETLRRWDPERIGPYALLGRLGAGAMGQVYLGRSTAGRLVAVKTIKIELAEEAGFRARFAREVAAARRVSGVFTAAVVAADPEADVPWLATAYVPAPSLSQLVRACGPLPVPAIRWLAAGCAEALESIHVAGLVHRDLKPSNVLVAPDGPRVIDFGVARAAERIQLTVTRGAVGTPAYMAPEQARDTRQASMASDVFSLGATLLFAAAGHAPYQGETVMDVLVRLATEPPDLAGLPAELTGMITACLERSPRERPTSAALLAQLGPFVEAPADPVAGHSYLTDTAMALIGEYQRRPRAAGRAQTAEETSGDATSASHTALPVPPTGIVRRWKPWRQRHRLFLTWTGLATGAAVVAVAGAILGASLDRSPGSQGNSLNSSRGSQGNSPDRSPGNPGSGASGSATTAGPPGPPPGPPPSTFPVSGGSAPTAGMVQAFGDGNTVFVLHGTGWPPDGPVTVALAGHGVSPVRPVADQEGTFNYAIDQGHEFFAGQIPPGSYRVVVTGSGGRQARTRFQVHAPPPPGNGPPP